MYSHAMQFSNPTYQIVLLLLFYFDFELLLAYRVCAYALNLLVLTSKYCIFVKFVIVD
jgi:hypothetical protein